MKTNAEILIEKIVAARRTWPERLRKAKGEGSKLIGYDGRFIPEELIHAAGAVPYLICKGGEPEPVEATLPYMLRFLNPFARAQIGYHLLEIDPVIPMLDLIVAQCEDCHMTRLADMFEYLKLPTVRIGVPPDWDKSISADYYLNGLQRLKKIFEEITGNEISDQALGRSIEALNRLKALLLKIGELRKQGSPPIGGYDFIRLNHASFYWPPDEFEQKLSELYQYLNINQNPFPETAPRILFMGHVVAMGDYVVPKLIEDAGGVIVTEFLDEGMRLCQWNVKPGGDLMQNIADTYFTKRIPPCIFQPSWKKRMKHLEGLIKDYQVQGLVWYQLSFDEIYDMEYPIISDALEKLDIPVLRLESSYEYAREAMGPLTTRVESFVEALEEGGANTNG